MSNPGQKNQKPRNARNIRVIVWAAWFGFAMLTMLILAVFGAVGGYQAAETDWQRTQEAGQVFSLAEQYALGLQDVQQGSYDLAQQRFEYILGKDPDFPGAAESLAQVIQIQSATATPTQIPATQTPAPTRDLRPVDTLFTSIQNLFSQGDWDGSVNAILALRQADSLYRAAEVDGLLYRSLRNRGLLKIRETGNLEGGIYDLTLAERIGPLDVEATTQRDLARYYMMGSSFWEVYPEQAVYYFGLVASALPSMRDTDGWTAAARYRAALIQFADQLARDGDWCSAQSQYELALSYTNEAVLQSTLEYAAYQCNPPTDTPQPETETPTLTATLITTVVDILSPTPSPTTPVTATGFPTATSGITPSPTVQPSSVPTAESSPTLVPTETPAPTQEPSPTPPLNPSETASQTDLPTQTATPDPGTGSSSP
jgi:tetratricopeptide (TPR) repeat protein